MKRRTSHLGDTPGGNAKLLQRIGERRDRIAREKAMGFTPSTWQRFRHWLFCAFGVGK